MGEQAESATAPQVGRRLRLTRNALRLTQREFCRRAGISVTAYNHMEKGRARPSLDAGISIAATFGLTLDWIYLGDHSNLPHRLATTIDALAAMDEPAES